VPVTAHAYRRREQVSRLAAQGVHDIGLLGFDARKLLDLADEIRLILGDLVAHVGRAFSAKRVPKTLAHAWYTFGTRYENGLPGCPERPNSACSWWTQAVGSRTRGT